MPSKKPWLRFWVRQLKAPRGEEAPGRSPLEPAEEEAPAVEGETVTVDGQVDMLTDDSRAAFAAQMVEKQDVDAVTGVTISSNAIKEAVAEIVGPQAPAEEEAEAPAEEPRRRGRDGDRG